MWNSPDKLPDGIEGDCKEYIVAVKRVQAMRRNKVFVFAAYFLKNMPLVPGGCECLAGLSADECEDRHEEGCPVTGWYLGIPWEGEPSGGYEKMLHKGDELMGWQPMPEWSE